MEFKTKQNKQDGLATCGSTPGSQTYRDSPLTPSACPAGEQVNKQNNDPGNACDDISKHRTGRLREKKGTGAESQGGDSRQRQRQGKGPDVKCRELGGARARRGQRPDCA